MEDLLPKLKLTRSERSLIRRTSSLQRQSSRLGGKPEKGDTSRSTAEDDASLDFLAKVTEIRRRLQHMDEQMAKVEDLSDKTYTATRTGELRNIRDRIAFQIKQAKAIAVDCSARIKGLANAFRQSGLEPGSSEARLRQDHLRSLMDDVEKRMRALNNLRDRLHEEEKESVRRRVLTITGQQADEEAVSKLVDTGQQDQLFKHVLMGEGAKAVENTLKEIEERHGTMKELEKSILELREVFLDVAISVEAQQTGLDITEAGVAATKTAVQKGAGAIKDARTHQVSLRQWRCFFIVFILVIIALVAVALGITYGSSGGQGTGGK